VSLDVIVLALASAPRPAGLAALYALLSASHAQRVLVAYIAAGFTFSVAIGVVVVAAFDGAGIEYGGTTAADLIELLAGVAALGFAVGVWSGRAQLPSRGDTSAAQSAMVRRLERPSVGTAAVAGIATHLPGFFYLVALNAIVAERNGLLDDIVAVLVFNAIWFGAAIATVVYFMIRPGAARRALLLVSSWARRHARGTTVFVFGVVGIYLSVNGAVGLLD
jgi:Sap, sulfolipid-1-addressing protein